MRPEQRSRKTMAIVVSIVGAFVIVIGILLVVRQFSARQMLQTGTDTTMTHNSSEHEASDMPAQQSEQTHTAGSGAVQTGEVNLEIKDFAYTPAEVTVKKGTKVTWTNQDDTRHDITPAEDKPGAPHSELLSKGQSYSFTFDVVGEYGYFCSPHPYMKGMIKVVE